MLKLAKQMLQTTPYIEIWDKGVFQMPLKLGAFERTAFYFFYCAIKG
jgi:hypothetical protein